MRFKSDNSLDAGYGTRRGQSQDLSSRLHEAGNAMGSSPPACKGMSGKVRCHSGELRSSPPQAHDAAIVQSGQGFSSRLYTDGARFLRKSYWNGNQTGLPVNGAVNKVDSNERTARPWPGPRGRGNLGWNRPGYRLWRKFACPMDQIGNTVMTSGNLRVAERFYFPGEVGNAA
jgi:hypothetical protein